MAASRCRFRGAILAGGVVLALLLGQPGMAAEASRQPNIVLILADDLGYGDLGCYGDRIIQTPNLDRFAAEGLRLTSCYSAGANCSPSRAGLMTGRTPTRIGIHNWIPMLSPMHLRKEEVTIATLLRKAGYATAHVGKWHLNGMFNLPGQPQPGDHGFDHWFSAQNNALPNHRNPYNFVRNRIPVGEREGYSGPLVADEAIRWLTKGRDREKPFFLYVCFHEPHEPIATDRKFTERYSFPNEPSRAAHHGNITQMDDAFGRLMRALDEQKLRETTLVFFTSDNGPAITNIHPHGSAGPLREKKGHLYEGGIRVPGLLRWPGKVKPGSVSDEPVCGVDLLPTLCAVTGVKAPADRALDGASILPVFEGKPVERPTPLYWHFNGALSRPKVALRVGDWKVLGHLNTPEFQRGADIRPEEQKALKTAEVTSYELYNLRADVGEKNDLAAKEPERLKKMAHQLQKKYREVRDESPTWPVWEWPRYEAERIQWPDYKGKQPKQSARPEAPPNFVVILCDNLGYGDIGCYGSKRHRTPNIDRLATEGMRFTDFYVSSGVCTPSRASLLTGCYPRRVNLHVSDTAAAVLQPVSSKGLHPDEVTLAEVLKAKGYATACIGKWHLGDQPALLPTRQGFDSFFGIPYSDDMTPRDGKNWPPLPLMRGEKVVEAPADRDLLTRRYTEEAVRFLTASRDRPFFLYLAHAMPGSTTRPFASETFRGRGGNGPYGDSVEEIDWSTGEILKALRELKLDEQTLILWTSDNGAVRRDPAQGSNGPLAGWGYTTAEGGMRVPCLARWPGKVPAGKSCAELATTMDLLPTFAKLAGTKPPVDRVIDGRDIGPLLAGAPDARSPHEAFYYYHMDQLQAVRSGQWKLYLPLQAKRGLGAAKGKPSPLALYDLAADLAEKDNLADKHPDVVKRLTALAERTREDLGDGGRPGKHQRPAGHEPKPTPRALEPK